MNNCAFNSKHFVALYDFISARERIEKFEFDFWLELARNSEGPILELGCGTGRLLLPLARAGFRIHGIDYSSAMLAALRSRLNRLSAASRSRCSFELADMRNFRSSREKYSLIILAASQFAYLATDKERVACLRHCKMAVGEDGLVVVSNSDYRQPEAIHQVPSKKSDNCDIYTRKDIKGNASHRQFIVVPRKVGVPVSVYSWTTHPCSKARLESNFRGAGLELASLPPRIMKLASGDRIVVAGTR
jgi:SAM-dependent methyltransferase